MPEPTQQINADGGSEIHNVLQVAGDYFNIFASGAPDLKKAIRSQAFGALFADRIRLIVGREHLVRSVLEMVIPERSRSGYILVRGEPGIGKTTFACMLLRLWACAHHFNIAQQNIVSTRAFLENICAQIIVKYQLKYDSLPPDAGRDGGFLAQVLQEAASKSQEPVRIIIDALDEAEDLLVPGANKLFLPASLPDNVYIVLTTREQIDYRLDVERLQDLYIGKDDPHNLADVRAYITTAVGAEGGRFPTVLANWNLDTSSFVDLLEQRSEGNFMYLVRVLADIQDGVITPDNLGSVDHLPKGLRAYYQRHWRQMRDVDRQQFEDLFEPALRLLASAREPVSLELLAEWTRTSLYRVSEVVSAWRQFLTEQRVNKTKCYAIYHASFRDFLSQEGVGLKPSHLRIAQTAISKIKGV